MGSAEKNDIKQEIARMKKEIASLKKANAADKEDLQELAVYYVAQENDIEIKKKELDSIYDYSVSLKGSKSSNISEDSIESEKQSLDKSLKEGYVKVNELETKIKALKKEIAASGKDAVSPEAAAKAKAINEDPKTKKKDRVKPETIGQEINRLKAELTKMKSGHSEKISVKLLLKTIDTGYKTAERFRIQGSHLKKDMAGRNDAIRFYEKRSVELKAMLDKPEKPSPETKPKPNMKF